MKRHILSCCLLLACGIARGQTTREVFEKWVSNVEAIVIPAADAMPEALYSFTPSGPGFGGVRTFGEQVKHLAAANYQLGAAAAGEKPPEGTRNESAPESVRTRSQILAYLRGSFSVLHRAAAALSDSNTTETVALNGKAYTRIFLIIDALAHSSNHYGQMVEYLRMNSIVPPESR